MPHIIDSLKTEGLLDHSGWRQALTSLTVSNTTTTLTIDSTVTYYLTGSTTGQILRLPSGLTLQAGHRFEIWNGSSTTVVLQDGSGATIFSIFPNYHADAQLLVAGSAAGTWGIQATGVGVASGIINYKVTATASFAPGTALTPITSMTVTPLQGTYAIWFNCSASIVTNNVQTSAFIYNGATQVTDSARLVQNSVATFNTIISTQTISTFNGTDACTAQTSRTGGTLTMTGRSLILIRLGD